MTSLEDGDQFGWWSSIDRPSQSWKEPIPLHALPLAFFLSLENVVSTQLREQPRDRMVRRLFLSLGAAVLLVLVSLLRNVGDGFGAAVRRVPSKPLPLSVVGAANSRPLLSRENEQRSSRVKPPATSAASDVARSAASASPSPLDLIVHDHCVVACKQQPQPWASDVAAEDVPPAGFEDNAAPPPGGAPAAPSTSFVLHAQARYTTSNVSLLLQSVDDAGRPLCAAVGDAFEVRMESTDVLLRTRVRRVCGGLYVAVAVVLEPGTYATTASIMFTAHRQWMPAGVKASVMSSALGTAPKDVRDAFDRRWRASHDPKSFSWFKRYASPFCLMDPPAQIHLHGGREGTTTTTQNAGQSSLTVVVDHSEGPPAATPQCASLGSEPARDAAVVVGGGGRWVRMPDGRCRAPYCSGDLAGIPEMRGWVYVPFACHYHFFPRADLWDCLRGQLLVFLGDSTTADTVRQLVRTLLGSISSPPSNRWSHPYEIGVFGPEGAKSDDLLYVFHHRIGSLEGEGYTTTGLEFFSIPEYRRRVASWLAGRPAGGVHGKRRPQQNTITLERKSSDAPLSGRRKGPRGADAVFAMSGPHDCRQQGHTLQTYRKQLQEMQSFLRKSLSSSANASALLHQPRLFWRGNVDGAGEGYRCSRVENPWRYEAMNRASREVLSGSSVNDKERFQYIDAFDVTFPLHWNFTFGDGIHYGRPPEYQPHNKRSYDVLADVMLAVMMVNGVCPVVSPS